tara:strand:+ start:910 stop:1434 length:525 start_codon:yes stop_codon:yes gene_type:complete
MNYEDIKPKKVKSPIDGSDKCFYEVNENGIESYLCMSTGFTTTGVFKKDSPELTQALSRSPQLITDLQFYDEERELVWFPVVLNMGKRGMIYPQGTKDKWAWKFASIIDIPEDEQEKYPIPGKDGQFYETKLDVENALTYENTQFVQACDDMGILEEYKEDESDGDSTEEVQSQ